MPTSQAPQLPPRGERFADPVARAVWAAILQLSAGDQNLILDELRLRLSRIESASSHDTRVRHAISALRECAEILRHSPSVAEYRRFRAEFPERSLPSDSSVRGWLGGSWNTALQAARLDAVPDGDVVVLQQGSALTEEEATKALQECAADLGTIPTLHSYLSWVRQPEVKARPGRRPSSQSPFDRLFQGFPNALVAAGLLAGDLQGLPRSSRVRLAHYFVDRECCIRALQEVASTLGHPPRVREYNAERERRLASPPAGEEASAYLPAASTIQKEFGTWDSGLVEAGLEPLGGRATGLRKGPRKRSGPRFSWPELIAFLVEAYQDPEVGAPFTSGAYKRWRSREIAVNREARHLRPIPSYDLVWARFGSWAKAVEVVYRAIEQKKTGVDEIAASLDGLLEGIVEREAEGE